jgi:hypothetical protein
MANNTNKRIPIKWIRDRAKAAYDKQDCCYICATTQELELHHLCSLTHLLNTWSSIKNYDISTDEGILEVRDEFIEEHRKELYEDVFTLCNTHHMKLHGIYGKVPLPTSVDKQRTWIDRQRAKYLDGYVAPVTSRPELSLYGQFLT